jgi:hypothetical protein
MRAWILAVGVVGALGSSGCAGASLVAARAAEDMHCPASRISVTSREMGGYDAQGCGKRESYMVRGGEVMPDTGAQDDLPAAMPKGGD